MLQSKAGTPWFVLISFTASEKALRVPALWVAAYAAHALCAFFLDVRTGADVGDAAGVVVAAGVEVGVPALGVFVEDTVAGAEGLCDGVWLIAGVVSDIEEQPARAITTATPTTDARKIVGVIIALLDGVR